MTIKSVHLVNIQSHKDALLEFPPTGVIRIAGNNSAGKSAVFKPFLYAMWGNLHSPETRAGLVSRNTPYGEATYTLYDGTELVIHITITAATTWVSLARNGEEPIKRYLADKSYKELITAFGMHYSETRDISLNYGAGDSTIHFFSSSYRANGEMVTMALTDKQAEIALERLEFTLSQARTIKEQSTGTIPVLEDTLHNIVTYDVDELQMKKEQYIKDYDVLSKVYFPNIPEIHAVPNVKVISMYVPRIPVIKYPRFYDINPSIPNILPIARELKEVMDGRCPTCGRAFSDVS